MPSSAPFTSYSSTSVLSLCCLQAWEVMNSFISCSVALSVLLFSTLAASSFGATVNLSRQASPCAERCLLGRQRVQNNCSRNRSQCQVARCRLSRRRRGYICTARSGATAMSSSPVPSMTSSPVPSMTSSPVPSMSSSPIPSVSSSPAASMSSSPAASFAAPSLVPTPAVSQAPGRFQGALICVYGTNQETFNVGVVNKAGELHIASFSVEEDTAMRQLECINNDLSRMSVEEYLEFADENCAGEEEVNCVVTDLEAGDCRCFLKTPVRCLFSPYRRSLARCANDLL